METKRIRELRVETVFNVPDSTVTNFISMVYGVGNKRSITIDGVRIPMTISDIIVKEQYGQFYFVLYLTNKEVTREWISIPVNDRTSIFYFID